MLLAETDNHKNNAIKSIPKRKPLPKTLPRKLVTIYLSLDQQGCGCCHGQLHKMGKTRSEKLKFVPAHIKGIETVHPRYTCKRCEKTGTGNQ